MFVYYIKMPPTEWNNAVKNAFKAGRKTNKNYSLKQAMLDAKKLYKKGTTSLGKFGKRQTRRSASPKRVYNRRKYRGGGLPPLSPVSLTDSVKISTNITSPLTTTASSTTTAASTAASTASSTRPY